MTDHDVPKPCLSRSWTDRLHCALPQGHKGQHMNQTVTDVRQVKWIDEPEAPVLPARPTASTITDQQLDELHDELAALRAVARGYCQHCGRGDAAPGVEHWEQQKRRADQAEELLHIAHETSNKSEAERARAVQRAEEAARRALEQRQEMAEERYAWQQRGDRAEARLAHLQATSKAAGILLTRTTDERDQLRAALDRVRALAEAARESADTRWFADQLDAALDEPGLAPAAEAATQATDTTPIVDRPFRSHRQEPGARP